MQLTTSMPKLDSAPTSTANEAVDENDERIHVAAVKRAVLTAVNGYLRRASSGGMPKDDVDTVRAVIEDMLRLPYLDHTLEIEGTTAAVAVHESAFFSAIGALQSCRTDEQGVSTYDEAMVGPALYDLIMIRTRRQLATSGMKLRN